MIFYFLVLLTALLVNPFLLQFYYQYAKNGYSIPPAADESEPPAAGQIEHSRADESEPLKIDSI